MKNTFSVTNIIFILLICSGIIFSQNNYSPSTIEKLNELRNNIELAHEENDSLSITRTHYRLALKYDYLGERDSSNLYYSKALAMAKILNYSKAIAVISNSFATTFSDQGLHEKARKMYSEVVELFLSLSDTSEAADVMLNISMEYVDIGKYKKAIETAFDALDLRLSIADLTI